MFNAIWDLFELYSKRPDLQKAFPEVKDGNLTGLLNWATFASQNLNKDKEAFEFLKTYRNFYFFAYRYNIFLPLSNFSKLPSLFFILGASRSGTTLLKRIMNCHSLTWCLEEGRAYNGINSSVLMKMQRIFESRKKWLGLKAPALTDCLLSDDFIEFPIPNFKPGLAEKFRHFYSNQPIIFLFRDVRDRVASVINLGKKIEVDFKELEKLFEKWIKLNPYIQKNFSEELLKIKKFKEKIFAYEALDWKIKNSAFFKYKAKGYPILPIKYEDFVRNPEQSLRKITSFLEIPFEASLLDFHKIPHPGLIAPGLESNFDDTTRDFDSQSIGLHKKYLPSKKINEIMEIASDTMSELNY